MEQIYFLKADEREIEGKKYYRITILDLNYCQIFSFYKLKDVKTTAFISNRKTFENISSLLTFAIKRNNKISFDIK